MTGENQAEPVTGRTAKDQPVYSQRKKPAGEVAERLNALVSKTSFASGRTWVRIPPSPLNKNPCRKPTGVVLRDTEVIQK